LFTLRRVMMTLIGSTLLIACSSAPGNTDPFAVLPSVPSTVWIAPTDLMPGTTAPDGAAVEIVPDDDVQAILGANPPGTTYSFSPGIYREIQIVPKKGDIFVGRRGAILSGARLLTDLEKNGDFWSEGGLDQEGERRGSCLSDQSACTFPEDVYFNDELLTQVRSIDELQPGSWFFDYENDTVYLADDPSGNKVEIAVVPYAFRGAAGSVTIRGFVIEKYANPAQRGAIGEKGTGPDWTVGENEIRLNHGIGVKAGPGARILGNYIHHNGQLGVGGSGQGILVEGNEIAYNNIGGFNPYWGGGGAKFVMTVGLVVIDNYVHHNIGPGLWTDIDNMDTRYESNLVVANYHAGIKHEISYDAVIIDNVVEGNGFGNDNTVAGAGIFVSSSPNVEVTGNVVKGNFDGIGGLARDRGDGRYGPYELRNFYVHDNEVEMADGYTGIVSVRSKNRNAVYTEWGNRFEGNNYSIVGGGKHFWWLGKPRTFDEWTSYGLDTSGSMQRQ